VDTPSLPLTSADAAMALSLIGPRAHRCAHRCDCVSQTVRPPAVGSTMVCATTSKPN
jgi:hypothetical protein